MTMFTCREPDDPKYWLEKWRIMQCLNVVGTESFDSEGDCITPDGGGQWCGRCRYACER